MLYIIRHTRMLVLKQNLQILIQITKIKLVLQLKKIIWVRF